MKSNLLTAIVPVSNPSAHRTTLGNILIQTVEMPINLVIVLDSENKSDVDEINEILRDSKNTRAELITGNFMSPGLARNRGLEVTSTPWVTFWDADDYPIACEYFEMVRIADAASTDLCVGSYKTFEYLSHNEVDRLLDLSKKYDWLVNPGIWRCVFRTASIKGRKFNALRMGEDIQFLAEVISDSTDWSFYEPIVYKYVIKRHGQATSRKPSSQELLDAFSKLLSILEQSNRNNFALNMILCSRLATLAKKPSTYSGTFRMLTAGFLSGKLRFAIFVAALARVVSLKVRQLGA